MVTSLFSPILWTLMVSWRVYRFFSQLEMISVQSPWRTAGDIFFLALGFILVVAHWVLYIKGKKSKNEEQEKS